MPEHWQGENISSTTTNGILKIGSAAHPKDSQSIETLEVTSNPQTSW